MPTPHRRNDAIAPHNIVESIQQPSVTEQLNTVIQNTDEYPDLEELRKAALVRQKLAAVKAAQKKKYPKWDVLRMILWKNLTIRKRRKTQFILLLFQVFLWFGIACFSIVLRTHKSYYKDEPYAGLTQLVPRLSPQDFSSPVAISYNPDLNMPSPRKILGNETEATSVTDSNFNEFQQNLIDVSKGFLNYFKLTYNNSPPLHLFKNIEALIEAMREDKRIPFGIVFDRLDFINEEFSYQLLFWQKEVPIDQFDAFDCRKLDPRHPGPNPCGMTLYGKYGFTFAQTAMANSIIEMIARRQGLIEEPIIRAPHNITKSSVMNTSQRRQGKESFIQHSEFPLASSSYGNQLSNRRNLMSYDRSSNSYLVGHEIDPYYELDAGEFLQKTETTNTTASKIKELLSPNKYRLEFPGVSLVAERFPEHQAIRSYAKEIAPSAPFYFMFALVSVFSFVVMDMVMEKESKMKEIMKTYGLSSGMFWLSWLVTYALLNVIIVWCAIFICTIGGVFGKVTSIVVVALLIYIYLLSLITLGFMISVFFQKAQTASIAGMVFNIFLYALGWVIHQTQLSNYIIKGIAHLFSTITFSLSIIELVSMLPENGVPLSKLFIFSDNSIGLYIIIMTADTFLYFILAWYLDQVVQPDWGSTKPWTFVFEYIWKQIRKRTTKGKQRAAEMMLLDGEDDLLLGEDKMDDAWKADWVEPVANVMQERGALVKIRNLVKRFPGKEGVKTVVDGLNLDMYPGEIFGLLGHNGAGKTTTISMLTGMLQVDDGDATILGNSIRRHGEEARKNISVCPQQNLFFEDLTCLEHLIFFASLRGIDVSEGIEQASSPAYFFDLIVQKRFLAEQRGRIVDAIANMGGITEEIQRLGIVEMEKHFSRFGLSLFTDPNINYIHQGGRTVVGADTWPGVLAAIEKVGLSEKMFNTPRMLSGGMKRRLWLAIALIGDPKVVFLDEPTSGVDPLGRQELWRLIQDEKIAGRCIIITTHHMEEADILADRKAIMTAGRLRCVGSSLFLKSRFGIGYYLEVEIAQGSGFLDAAAAIILEFLHQYVPDAKRHEDNQKSSAMSMAAAKRNLLLFQLPISSVQAFADLFHELDTRKESLSIIEYGVSLSTLEEVFFKLGEEEEKAQFEVENAAARDEEAPPLPRLESLTERRGSVFPQIPPTAPGGKRAEDLMIMPTGDDTTTLRPLKNGTRGDLVSQKFKKTNPASTWKLLQAVIALRFVQISHNKLNFAIDVLFPVLMLMASLFFRDTGPNSLDLIKPKDAVAISIDQYSSVLNSTIPFVIDERLVGPGLKEAYAIIGHLPIELRGLLKKVDALSHELLQYDTMDDDHDDDGDDMGLTEQQLTPDGIHMGSAIGDTPVHGRPVRNYLWAKRDPSIKPLPLYAAGLSFEPRSPTITSREGDPHRLQIRLFYDAGLFHSLPLLISAITDAVMAAKLKPNSGSSTAPLPSSPIVANQTALHATRWHVTPKSSPLYMDIPIFVTAMVYRMYIMLSLGLSSLPSRFGIQIMFDKFMGTKHAMIVMGLPFSIYWLGSFVMNYLAMVFGNFVVCAFVAYFIPTFWSFAIVPVLVCAVFYSASVLLWAYFLSQLFYNLKAYAMTLQLTGMLLALCPAYLVSVFADASSSGAGSSYTAMLIHIVCSFLLPPYNPIGVLTGCALIHGESRLRRDPLPFSAYFALNRLPIWSVIASAVQAVVLFTATALIDRWHYHMKSTPAGAEEMLEIYYQRRNAKRNEWLHRRGGNQLLIPASLQDHKDEDVMAEEFECMKIHRILKNQEKMYEKCMNNEERQELSERFKMTATEDNMFPNELPLVLIDDLHYLFFPHTMNQPPHVAVRGFSISIYRGEIFGLLGPNGAGKTTSINLLTCNYMITAPTRGVALMGGHDVTKDPTAAFTHLGLCPQFDALWADVNVRDNLKVFARIKNVAERELDAVLDRVIDDLELQPHQHKRVSECSGGNKRRVSVAVSFMGNPDVVLMDEPSSGIDPVGRRRLAELIHRESEKRCVLITTHSMEEAEALCSRIGIIVNGELNCLNTSLAIRNKYGAGIRLEVIFDDTSSFYVGFDPSGKTLNPWQLFVQDKVSADAMEIDRVANRMTYDIPLKSNSLGQLFGLMESNKAQFAVKDYALSQPTLEQVFITFAKRQKSAQESVQEILKD